jgi:hypothetical protein
VRVVVIVVCCVPVSVVQVIDVVVVVHRLVAAVRPVPVLVVLGVVLRMRGLGHDPNLLGTDSHTLRRSYPASERSRTKVFVALDGTGLATGGRDAMRDVAGR